MSHLIQEQMERLVSLTFTIICDCYFHYVILFRFYFFSVVYTLCTRIRDI